MSSVPNVTLNTGATMPRFGLGVWQAGDEDTERAVRFAIDEAGYRLIDTAKAYGNEEGVGRALKSVSVPRDELFVTTKLWNADHGRDRALKAFDDSLERLGLDYVDLYLIHWPTPRGVDTLVETWLALEEIAAGGRAKAIGVCNCKPHHLQQILDAGSVVPAVDQIELHPHFPQQETRDFAAEHGVVVESWSPLGGTSNAGWGTDSRPNTLLADPVLTAIGARYGKTAAQVMIRWHLQLGLVVIPKSVHEERIRQNIDVFDFELSDADMAKIATLDTGERVGADPDEADF